MTDLPKDFITAFRLSIKHYRMLHLHLFATISFIIAIAALGAAVPYLFRQTTDGLSKSSVYPDIGHAIILAGSYGLCWTAMHLSEWLKSMASAAMLVRCEAAFQKMFYSHLIRVEYDRLIKIDPGTMTAMLERSRSAFGSIAFTFVGVIAPTSLQLIFSAAVLWRTTDLVFAAVFTVSMFGLFLVTWWLAARTNGAHAKIFGAGNLLTSHIVEKLSFSLDIKLNNAYAREDKSADVILNRYVAAISSGNVRLASLLALQAVFAGALLTTFVILASIQVAHAAFSIGDFVMIVGYIAALTTPLTVLAGTLSDLRRNHLALKEGFQILALPLETGLPEIEFDRSATNVISIEQVELLVGENRILQDVDLNVRRGQLTVLIGPSGSGKSSLVNLMLGLVRPTRGHVCVYGKNICDVSVNALSKEIAVVPQNPLIVTGSLRENLIYGCDKPPPDALLLDLVDMLELSNAGGDAKGDVLDRVFGIQGRELSGGERQRVALGRALARRPLVVIMDEPTSALDSAREARIFDQVRRWVPTILVATHREALVKLADAVYLVESGTVKNFCEQSGRYAQFSWPHHCSRS